MPLHDAAGHPLSLDDPAAGASWEACVRGFLAHSASTPSHLSATLQAAPGFALGHAACGFFQFLLGRRETMEAARAASGRARETCRRGGADSRERAYVEALDTALAGRLSAAAAALDAIAARWQGDALAVKLSHGLRFVLGDAPGMRRAVETAAPGFAPDHPLGGYVEGCRAFALEETGDYAAAEARGRAALERAPDDAWGLHAVAHVFEMTGRPEDGVRLLRRAAPVWAGCNNFGAHVWWHLALFQLDRGAFASALALYDSRVRAARTDDYRDIANAASLLARLELEGVAVGGRWEELAELAAARVEHGANVFADLHYLLALQGAGRSGEADRLADRLAADAARGASDMDAAAAAGGASAAAGLRLFAQGAHRAAYARLRAAHGDLRRVGGSHAQRDVFARLMTAAAIRGGLWAEAETALSLRPGLRPPEDRYARRRRAEIVRLRRAQDATRRRARPDPLHSWSPLRTGSDQGATQRPVQPDPSQA